MREQLMRAEQITPLKWRDGALHLLDQRYLPLQQQWLQCDTCAQVTDAIRDMVVRGAPAIGIAAAFAVLLSVREHFNQSSANWRTAAEHDV